MEETKKERINRVAREWYARNKERIRQKKLGQCHEYRRRKREGRPPREVAKPERVMVFDTETGELRKVNPEPVAEPVKEEKKVVEPETKIESGKFLVRFV
jgi:hypothetical protein